VDLTPYLVEALPPPSVAHAGTQTDAFATRPPSPPWVPPKTGFDAETQVPHGTRARLPRADAPRRTADGDVLLFDFDAAVGPLVDEVVGRVVAQAVTELRHERELDALHARRTAALAFRAEEAATVAALVAAATAAAAAKGAAVADASAATSARLGVMAKVACAALARSALAAALGGAVTHLAAAGYWIDPARAAVRSAVLPDLYASLEAAADAGAAARAALDGALGDALARGGAVYTAALAAAAAEAEAERSRPVPLNLTVVLRSAVATAAGFSVASPGPDGAAHIALGPIPVPRSGSLADVADAAAAWLAAATAPPLRALAAAVLGSELMLTAGSGGEPLPPARLLASLSPAELSALVLVPASGGGWHLPGVDDDEEGGA